MNRSGKLKMPVAAGALIAAGFAAGAVVAVMASASADDDTVTGVAAGAFSQDDAGRDPGRSMHPEEKLLTGATADKVRAAALKRYPNATVQRVETDSDGVYEAHIVTAAGEWVTVQVGKDFAVTGVQTGRGGHGPRGHHGWGDRDGDGRRPSAPPAPSPSTGGSSAQGTSA